MRAAVRLAHRGRRSPAFPLSPLLRLAARSRANATRLRSAWQNPPLKPSVVGRIVRCRGGRTKPPGRPVTCAIGWVRRSLARQPHTVVSIRTVSRRLQSSRSRSSACGQARGRTADLPSSGVASRQVAGVDPGEMRGRGVWMDAASCIRCCPRCCQLADIALSAGS